MRLEIRPRLSWIPVNAESEDLDVAPRLCLFIELFQRRMLLPAGKAPRAPNANEDNFATQILGPPCLSSQVSCLEIAQLIPKNKRVCGDSAAQPREHGVVLLRIAFTPRSLTILKEAATRCFDAIGTESLTPSHYRFSPFSLGQLFSEAMGCEWTCRMEQSWVRKKFVPSKVPSPQYHPQSWHQDGALGVHFPSEPGTVIPMTELLTCWIPLNRCGRDSPGLEFVRGRQPALVHFMELDDATLRRRFEPHEFWAPNLEFGDGLVFLNSILHRTYARPEMPQNRLSVEYRIFPL
jgi:hypothetical protein